MDIVDAILLAIVEGITEFLPVSSTGHMIIAQTLLKIPNSDFVKSYIVIIQFGAILSVVYLYYNRFFRLNKCAVFVAERTLKEQKKSALVVYTQRFLYKFDFYWKLFLAFLPAAFLGLVFSDKIDEMLESVKTVAYMLVIGGVVMLFVDYWFRKHADSQEITTKRAITIGFFQCIAMIPGVSRSMATIVGGMSQGLTRKNAAEFSFFLAVPTMFAATLYKIYKLIKTDGIAVLQENITVLLVGNVVAFIIALLAIKFFIGFVTKYGFKAFGYYRIVVGGAILILLALGYQLQLV